MKKLILIVLILGLIPGVAAYHDKYERQSIKNKIVNLTSSSRGQCSGQQVKAPSGKSYILTAAHCKSIADADGSMLVTLEDGSSIRRSIIEEDGESDLLLLEGLPGIDGLPIGDSITQGDAVRTFSHGNGLPTYSTSGDLIGIVDVMIPTDDSQCNDLPKYKRTNVETFFGMIPMCVFSVKEQASTAQVAPGSSGGAVINSKGELVGVISASYRIFAYFVTLQDIHNFLRGY